MKCCATIQHSVRRVIAPRDALCGLDRPIQQTTIFLFAVASTLNAWSHHTVHHTCYNNKRYGLGLARTLCGTECVTTLVTTHTAAVAA